MPNSEDEYLLVSEVVRADGIVEKIHIGTARRFAGALDEWEFLFERIPLGGKVWARNE